MENIIIILIIAFLAFEFVEHLVFPLIWSLIHRKKKSFCGPGRILREVGEVREWREKEVMFLSVGSFGRPFVRSR